MAVFSGVAACRLRFAALALAAFGACGGAAAKDVITLCYERQEVLPWRTLDQKGLNFELLEQVASRVGISFDYQSMPWKRCLAQLKANEVGGAFAVSFAPERMDIAAYPGGVQPDPARRMHVDRYVLLRRRGSALDWDGKTFRNVHGAIGAQLGYSVASFLRAQKVQVDEGSQRASELAQKLVAGRLDGAAVGGGDAVVLMRGPLAAQLEVVPVPLVEKPYYLLLSHALVDANPELADRIWKAVEQVRTSPAYRQREREATGGGH